MTSGMKTTELVIWMIKRKSCEIYTFYGRISNFQSAPSVTTAGREETVTAGNGCTKLKIAEFPVRKQEPALKSLEKRGMYLVGINVPDVAGHLCAATTREGPIPVAVR